MINQPRQRAGVRAIVGNAFIAALAVFAAGCDLSTGEATVNSINQFVQVRNPIGHVQGLVTDSNGRPLQNALVTTGSRQTTTNSGGYYEFRDLEVVNATENTTANDTAHPAISLSIRPTASTFAPDVESGPPSGQTTPRHLGAIVFVYPEAQLNNTSGQSGVISCTPIGAGSPVDCESTGSQVIFVDGFRVEADLAVLPELNATVEILALRDEDTGQLLPSGTSVTLDFDEIDGNTDTEDDGSEVNYPTATWATTVQTNGSVTFTNVAANSLFGMHVRGYSCDSDEDNNVDFDDTCEISSGNETNVATYANYLVKLITDDGDTVDPFPVSVAGNYANDAAMLDTACLADVGLLTRAVSEGTTLNITFNETILAPDADNGSVAVYDTTNDEYLALTGTDGVSASGRVVTLTLASALPAGVEFSVYLFRPDFTDQASNVITDNDTGSDFDDINCEDIAGNWVGYVAIDLHTFSEPNTNVAAVTPVQEEIDPVDSGADNDLPVNQAQSVAYNDVDDDAGDIQQLNADNTEFKLEGLELRADAFGAISGVAEVGTGAIDVRTARVEFTPATGASGYRISRNADADVEVIEPDEFDDNDDVDGYAFIGADDGVIDGDGDLRIQNVDRGAGTLYALVVDDSEEGDVICVEALDDLGNAGTAGCVTVVDNVEPTVTIQRSYHADADFTGGVDDGSGLTSIEFSSSGDNVSSCFSHNNGHAGIALASGTTSFGEGGELTDPGAAQAVGNLCIGASPELLVDADTDSTSAHTELEAGRTALFNTTAGGANATAYPRAYDGAAFTAWARPTPIKMGAAFTEDLLTTVTPVETGVSAALSNFVVQNNTLAGHISAPVIEDLVSFDVDDVYDLANADHSGTIDFTGVADLAGNTASAAANAVLTVRDQWPPYLVATTQRNADGTITFVFDTAVTIQGGDEIELADGNATVLIDFTRDGSGDPLNFTQSVDGKTVTRLTDGLPETAGYPALFDDAALTYTDALGVDTQHVITDFSQIFDTRGNRWDQHGAIDTPLFVLPDALATFDVVFTETAAAADTDFNVVLTANHPISNYFELVDNGQTVGSHVFTGEPGGGQCTLSGVTGVITCDETFVVDQIAYTDNSAGACDFSVDSTATLNAARTTLTFNIVCDTGTVDATDVFAVVVDNNTDAISDYDGNVEDITATTFVLN